MFRFLRSAAICLFICLASAMAFGQVTTQGFLNLPRTEAPGTLLSHPLDNDSEAIGRTTSITYLNGWIIVGGEAPGSRVGSDLVLRVYDISDPEDPVRRHPSDFGLTYDNNYWHQGNYGWGAHGTAQSGSLLLPGVMRVQTFGGIVELGGTNGIPNLAQMPLWYNRASQAGPWEATMAWYGSPNETFEISHMTLSQWGYVQRNVMAEFDHVGPFGGGDWHPMFFGDLLVYARSGGAGRDGVVVYRLQYNNFDDPDPANRSITPQFVGSMDQGFEGYWPTFFSDGSGLYVIGSSTDILVGADITEAADPAGTGQIDFAASLNIPQFTNASYPVFQDQYAFIHNRKIDTSRFLAGDPNPIVLTLDEDGTEVNTSQMSLALGNLWLTGGYPIPGHNQGMGVWVHQQAPDTTAPQVTYHVPQTGRTNYPRHAPLSFLLHEHPRNGGPRNGIDFTVRQVLGDGSLDTFVPGFLIHDFSGVLTFTPDTGLVADATYQVDFLSDPGNAIGFVDAAGNAIEPYSYRFSTGGGIDAVAPPSISEVTASDYYPAPGESLDVTIVATGTGALEYRFNFDSTWSAWGSSATASHTYATEGRPQILVQVRDDSGQISNGSLRPLVIEAPTGPAPTQSSTMAVGDDAGGRRLWTVNPDANTVSVLDATTGAKIDEHTVGTNPRNIARDAQGRYWVTCHQSDEIWVLGDDGSTHTTIALDYGAAPYGVCPSPDGSAMYVTLYGSAEVQRYTTATPSAAPVSVASPFSTPRAIAVSGDGSRVLVTRFISAHLQAQVAEFSGSTLAYQRTIPLRYSIQSDGGDRAAGMPNYLASIAISPDGSRAAIASKQDNIVRGNAYGLPDLTHETMLRSVVSFLDLSTNQEVINSRKDFDNSDSPTAVAYTPIGDTLLVALQGNNRVVGLDTLSLASTGHAYSESSAESTPAVITVDLAAGLAPQGLLIDPVSNRLFIQNLMGRSVTVRDATPLLQRSQTTAPLLATTDTVATELLSVEVLLGKQIFYNAADPRMGADSYISCASCHVDGGHDGQTWDFTGRGDGLRRTTDLRGRSGVGHGNVHWSGNFDEIQDFEHDIRDVFGGEGFLDLTPLEFADYHPSPASGKTGLSTDLDALAAYVTSLGHAELPRSPQRQADGSLSAAAQRGETIFTAQACATCHSGDALTDSLVAAVDTHALHDTGTLTNFSGGRLGGPLTGIDTPTLHGLHASRTFLHHGQAESLADVFDYAGGQLYLAETATDLGGGSSLTTDSASEGGGGFFRGALGGTARFLESDPGSGIRFSAVDGGSGGTARIAIRYVRSYSNAHFDIAINGGAAQSVTALRQEPRDGWMTSGWRWAIVDTTLTAGATNQIDILRTADIGINAILVSTADDFTTAEPHRRVLSLSVGDQSDLLAYLGQLDGRDENGVPLADATAPAPEAPTVITQPLSQTVAVGNTISLFTSVSGTGPFTYQWQLDGATVGSDSPRLDLANVTLADAGSYTVRITNAAGNVLSDAAVLTINPPLSITTTTLPVATVGQSYATTLEAAGGTSTRTWELVGGVLPNGINLAPDGTLSGMATSAATAPITVQVSDESGSATQSLSLQVQPTGGLSTDSDLILHYTFDEGAGDQIWDASTNGNNHATTVANATWNADGRFGNAYGTANGGEVVVPFFPANQSDLDFDPQGDEYTFSVWVRTTVTSGYNTILGKDDGDVQNRIWMINTPDRVQAHNGGYTSATLDVATAPMNDGDWHLVTMVNTYDTDSSTWVHRLYYDDGTLVEESASGTTRVAGQLRVGDTTQGGNSWFGQIDDLRIYRRSLSPAEISDLYNATPQTDYTTWQNTTFTAEQLADPFLLGPTGDADGDGIDNITEFALADGEVAPLTIDIVETWAEISTNLRTEVAGITVLIESSTDMETWTEILSVVNDGNPAGTATYQQAFVDGNRRLVISDPATEARKYFRLRVVQD